MSTDFKIGDKVAVANSDGSEWLGTVKYVPTGDDRKRHDPELVDIMADGTGAVTSVNRSRLRPLVPVVDLARAIDDLPRMWWKPEDDKGPACLSVEVVGGPKAYRRHWHFGTAGEFVEWGWVLPDTAIPVALVPTPAATSSEPFICPGHPLSVTASYPTPPGRCWICGGAVCSEQPWSSDDQARRCVREPGHEPLHSDAEGRQFVSRATIAEAEDIARENGHES